MQTFKGRRIALTGKDIQRLCCGTLAFYSRVEKCYPYCIARLFFSLRHAHSPCRWQQTFKGGMYLISSAVMVFENQRPLLWSNKKTNLITLSTRGLSISVRKILPIGHSDTHQQQPRSRRIGRIPRGTLTFNSRQPRQSQCIRKRWDGRLPDFERRDPSTPRLVPRHTTGE